MTNETENKALATFEGNKVRKTWHNDKWYFSIEDIVSVLTDSVDAKQYIKKCGNETRSLIPTGV